VDDERFAVLDLSSDSLAWYAGHGAIPHKVRTALQQAAQLKTQVTVAERLRDQKQAEIQAIVTDQDRLRENMRTVTQNSDYYRRLLTKLNDQETKVETLQGERERLHADAEAKRTALAEFLRTLTVE
jgi:septal ring factor EnvC (AmiA/AmiB activator)